MLADTLAGHSLQIQSTATLSTICREAVTTVKYRWAPIFTDQVSMDSVIFKSCPPLLTPLFNIVERLIKVKMFLLLQVAVQSYSDMQAGC